MNQDWDRVLSCGNPMDVSVRSNEDWYWMYAQILDQGDSITIEPIWTAKFNPNHKNWALTTLERIVVPKSTPLERGDYGGTGFYHPSFGFCSLHLPGGATLRPEFVRNLNGSSLRERVKSALRFKRS